MDNESRPYQVMRARAAYAARPEAFRRAASPGRDTSPQAVEATLASISEEVTAEAIERRRDKNQRR
jgi:hypothetical protein